MGRLFDAAAAILGVCTHSQYEGEAAMRLEALAGRRPGSALPFAADETAEGLILDPLPCCTLWLKDSPGIAIWAISRRIFT